MNLTWKQLTELISKIPKDHIDDNVTVFSPEEGEFYEVASAEIVPSDIAEDCTEAGEILDEGCMYLTIDNYR